MGFGGVYVIIDAVFVAAFTGLIIFWNKKVKKENERSFGKFLLFPIGQAMFLAACLYNGKEFDISLITNPYLIIALVISVVSDITMYVALYENSRMQEMKQRVKQLEQEMEIKLKYYDSLSAQFDMIREYRHDIRNMVATAKALPQTDNGERDAELLIEGMERRAEKLSIPVYCQSPLINAVLWQKSREAEQSGVRFSAKVKVHEELPIDRLDMCSVLVNLLDNAIEEARKVGGSVFFSMELKAGILFIQTENTSERVFGSEEKPRSLKRGDHGHGSEILQKIASKYNGAYVLTSDGNKARAVVSICIK